MYDYRSYIHDHYTREIRASEQRSELGWNTDDYRLLREQRSAGPDLATLVRQIVARLECRFSRWRYRLFARTHHVPAVEPCS